MLQVSCDRKAPCVQRMGLLWLYATGYGAEQLSDIETKCASLVLLDLSGWWLAQQSMGSALSPVKRCPSLCPLWPGSIAPLCS